MQYQFQYQAAIGGLKPAMESALLAISRDLAQVEGALSDPDRDIRSIYVTSASRGEGVTTAAISLAYGLAEQANVSVALVDANLRAPALHEAFQVPVAPGLCEALSSMRLVETLRPTRYGRLAILTAGSPQGAGIELFSGSAFERKLAKLRQRFDYVILDGTPVLESSEPAIIAGQVDAVVLVLACEQTRWEVTEVALERLRRSGAHVAGTVLNRRRYYVPRIFYGGSR